ncbi:MAG: hypothetical protein M1821_004192 [Bathelium mastoideum]|nr:MAG: hypothetical protein M1821_004192 [Bathelium mastoideum]
MTSSPPEEAPEFRGKTLSPVSPKPVHLPSPSTIPVLENQMDPVFNDTATHMGGPAVAALPPFDSTAIPTSYTATMLPSPHMDASQANGVEGGGSAANGGKLQNTNGAMTDDKQTAVPSIQDHQSFEQISGFESSETAVPNQTASQSMTNASYPPTSSQSIVSHALPPNSVAERSQPSSATISQGAETSGVNYQAFLDNLVASSTPVGAAASGADAAAAFSNISATTNSQPPPPGTVKSPISAAPASANLPPRPPPQEQPSLPPTYDLRTFHPHSQNASLPASYPSQPANAFRPPGMYPPPNLTAGAPGASGLPPPPVPSFQHQAPPPPGHQQSPTTSGYRQRDSFDAGRDSRSHDEDTPWGPDVQKKYDDFLENERRYVSEGQWDRFPANSRLFIGGETLSDIRKLRSDGLAGNLPTEKVTKRDLFHVFHKHGTLAQISLKQAYGFVQFLDAEACYRALQAEQNQYVRGRKMHLEISKPQRSQKNQGGGGGGGRRSRSPDYGRASNVPAGTDRYVSGGRPASPRDRDRNRRRNRDDYRPGRSPSPRGYRDRRGGRGGRSPDRGDRYDGRRRSRSRSPYREDFKSPRSGTFEEDDLPFPRRDPRNVPDVQILILDNLDQGFVAWVEKAFRDRQIRVDSLHLHPRFSENAVVRRQMIEGVQAVIRLTRASQASGKIPLQVFDRSGGASNISWNEYQDLDPPVCAELVLRAKQTNPAPPTPTQQQPSYYPGGASANTAFPPSISQPQYGLAPTPQQQQPAAIPPAAQNPAQQQPNLQNIIAQLDPTGLQKLLAGMNQQPQQQQQSPQTPQMPPHHHPQHHHQQQHQQQHQQPPLSADLMKMLGGLQAPPPSHSQQPTPAQQQRPGGFGPPPSMGMSPTQQAPQNQYAHLMNMLGGSGAGGAGPGQGPTPGQQQQGGPMGPDVKDLMAQLTKYKR